MTRTIRILALPAALAILLAACGSSASSPSASAAGQVPGPAASAAGGGGGSATTPSEEAPADTPATGNGGSTSGGGGAVDSSHGSAHIEISGPVQSTNDVGFVPAGSIFGASATSLNFTDNLDKPVVIVAIVLSNNQFAISFTNSQFSIPGANCTTSDLKVDGTSASGKFQCADAAVIKLDGGAMISGATLAGSFQAHA